MKHRCRLVRIWLIHKPIAVSITLSCFIHLSHKCPVGLFHHIFQHLPRFRSGKSFSVVESQHWHRSPAREQCPDVSMRCSLLSPVHPNMDCCCSGSQRPFPVFLRYLPLHRFGLMQARERGEVLLWKLFYFKLYVQRLWYYQVYDQWVRLWINLE